jgi:hypothetical protein
MKMATRSLTVPLGGFGTPSTEAHVEVQALSFKARIVRAATVMGAGLAVALVALPIPLVHLVLVPAGLLLGITLGTLRLRHKEIFAVAEGACPFCGSQQRLGLRGKVFRLPRRVFCNSCRRELDLGKPA